MAHPSPSEQSMQWTRRGNSAPVQARVTISTNKVLVAFFDLKGLRYQHCLLTSPVHGELSVLHIVISAEDLSEQLGTEEAARH